MRINVAEKVGTGVLVAVLFAAIMAIFAVLLGYPTKWLWNALMPDIFGLKTITFWQAVRLLYLSGLLLKSSTSKSND